MPTTWGKTNNKLPRTIRSLLEWDVKGDGVYDDQPGFDQACTDMAYAGVLYVPPGTYRAATVPFRVKSGCKIVGAGWDKTFFSQAIPGKNVIIADSIANPARTEDIHIEGIRVEGHSEWNSDDKTISVSVSGNTWTLAAGTHNLSNGQLVRFSAATAPGGITLNTNYYIVGTTSGTNTFKVEASPGSGAITPSTAGAGVYVAGTTLTVTSGGTTYVDQSLLQLILIREGGDGLPARHVALHRVKAINAGKNFSLHFNDVEDSQITGCWVDRSRRDAINANGARLLIADNRVTNSGWGDRTVAGDGGDDCISIAGDDFLVRGNHIGPCDLQEKGRGIWAQGLRNSAIVGNVILAGYRSNIAVEPGVIYSWAASTVYRVGDQVIPGTGASGVGHDHKYIVTAVTGIDGSGTSGSSAPTWPTGAGATVTDGGVTWTENGTGTLTKGGQGPTYDVLVADNVCVNAGVYNISEGDEKNDDFGNGIDVRTDSVNDQNQQLARITVRNNIIRTPRASGIRVVSSANAPISDVDICGNRISFDHTRIWVNGWGRGIIVQSAATSGGVTTSYAPITDVKIADNVINLPPRQGIRIKGNSGCLVERVDVQNNTILDAGSPNEIYERQVGTISASAGSTTVTAGTPPASFWNSYTTGAGHTLVPNSVVSILIAGVGVSRAISAVASDTSLTIGSSLSGSAVTNSPFGKRLGIADAAIKFNYTKDFRVIGNRMHDQRASRGTDHGLETDNPSGRVVITDNDFGDFLTSAYALNGLRAAGVTDLVMKDNVGMDLVTKGRLAFAWPNANTTGVDTNHANVADIYVSEVTVPLRRQVTGVGILTAAAVGSNGTTDAWNVVLYDSAGNPLANSVLSGTLISTSNSVYQQIAFTLPPILPPGLYFVGLQANNTTAKFKGWGNTAGQQPLSERYSGGSFTDPFTVITPPTVFKPLSVATDRPPIVYLY